MKGAWDRQKTRSLVLRYLTTRARSRQEVCLYLERRAVPPELGEAVIREMEEYGYIDDSRFADEFIASRKRRGFGRLRVRYELEQKGLERALVRAKVGETFDPEEDRARIKEILAGRPGNGEGAGNRRKMLREAAFLKRRGFEESLILDVLGEEFSGGD